MNDWLTYLGVIVLVLLVGAGVYLYLKTHREEEVNIFGFKFRPDPQASPTDLKLLKIVIFLSITFALSFSILASINSFFPRPAPANTNTPQPSLVPTATVAVATAMPQPTTRIAANTESPTATRLPATNTQPPTPIPTLGIRSTQISKADGMVQVYVPAGVFTMGSDFGDSDEKPVHAVILDAFWIDKFEVTNAMYAMCVKASMCPLPQSPKSYIRTAYFGNPQYDNYPVIYVTWGNATTYCGWAERRLPTEAEWEKAARGIDGRTYPWGNQFDGTKVNSIKSNPRVDDTTEVGKYPNGTSPYGALDMAGNVWEWVNDWYDENYYRNSPSQNPTGPSSGQHRTLRGGSWTNDDSNVRASDRDGRYVPTNSYFLIGFRCASSP